MSVWLLRAREDLPSADNPWDSRGEYFVEGLVVRAATAQEARQLAATQAGDEGWWPGGPPDQRLNPWLDAHYTTCVCVEALGAEAVLLLATVRYGAGAQED